MDEEALRASLAELRQQEEGIKGLLALNPESVELTSLFAQVGEARSMTESALLALCQSRLLESIESTAPAPPPPPPPPSLPPVGAVVSARYAETVASTTRRSSKRTFLRRWRGSPGLTFHARIFRRSTRQRTR